MITYFSDDGKTKILLLMYRKVAFSIHERHNVYSKCRFSIHVIENASVKSYAKRRKGMV